MQSGDKELMSDDINKRMADWCGIEYRSDGAGNWLYWNKETGMPIMPQCGEFTESRDACALMEDEMEERGLWEYYINELYVLCSAINVKTNESLNRRYFLTATAKTEYRVEAWRRTVQGR